MEERLQKIIARAGVASRRHAEEMIVSGLVTVNGHTVTELGTKADASRDHIKVAGKLVRPPKGRLYLMLNKPAEVVSTMSDPEGRESLLDLLHGVSERVFPVGRLEYHSSGLVFLTNDGDLANKILRSHRIRQTYQLKLKTLLTFAEIESLARATGAHIVRIRGKESPWYEVTLSEARSDKLRNKLFQTGHPVEKIRRVRIANLELGGLAPGGYRELSAAEVAAFTRAVTTGEHSTEVAPASAPQPRAKHASHPPVQHKRPRTFSRTPPRTSSRPSSRDSLRTSPQNPRHAPPRAGERTSSGASHSSPRYTGPSKFRRTSPRNAPRTGQHKPQGTSSRTGPHNPHSTSPRGPRRDADQTPRSAPPGTLPRDKHFRPGGHKNRP
jgi:23S rRNA pseudouridine2605 synthase